MRSRRQFAVLGSVLALAGYFAPIVLETPVGAVRLVAAVGSPLLLAFAFCAPDGRRTMRGPHGAMFLAVIGAFVWLFHGVALLDRPEVEAIVRTRTPIGTDLKSVRQYFAVAGIPWRESRDAHNRTTGLATLRSVAVTFGDPVFDIEYTFDDDERVETVAVESRDVTEDAI